MISILLAALAMVALENGDYFKAQGQLVESVRLLRAMGEKWQTARTLEVFACLAAMRDRPNFRRAAQIFGAAEVFRETLAAPVLPF